jgi:nitrate reductase NapAB chaperone NapD
MLTTSVVEFLEPNWALVKACLDNAAEVDIYGVDAGRALVVIDSTDEKGLEEICRQLHAACAEIISISHHSFYFEETHTMPPAEELFRKKI